MSIDKERHLSSTPPMLSSSGVASPVESSAPTTEVEDSPVVVAGTGSAWA